MKIILLVLSILAPLALVDTLARAEQPAKIRRIGYLGGGDNPRSPVFESFRQGLREIGYAEGQNIVIDRRPYYGDPQLNQSVAEMVSLNVDVIVAQGEVAVRVAMSATKTIPIVMSVVTNPVASDFVARLERPGRNVAGVNGVTTEIGGKWLELIKETIPNAKRIAVFWNRFGEQRFPIWKSVDSAARSLRVDLKWLEAGDGSFGWLYHNLRKAAWRDVDAFVILPGIGTFRNTKDVAGFGLRNRIPGLSWQDDFVEAGGLMSYGANSIEQSRRAAHLVDKILKGAKPAELPIERPTQFELAINLKTAKEIGVTIHPEILIWADKVIK